ncbi:hypothetical protein TELCIR_15194, partial [Teladorsagia circumcincta]
LCGKCKPAKVALIAANGAGTVTPTRKVLTNTAAGCNRMHVICTAPAGGTIASMEFNKQFGGGYEAKTVTALLKCNAKQNWIFTKDGVSKAITSVGCITAYDFYGEKYDKKATGGVWFPDISSLEGKAASTKQ